MQDRRRSAREITPQTEDRGLFKTKVGQFVVQLVPQFERSSRGDLAIRGFIRIEQGPETPICVLFAGRRTRDAAGLEQRLKTLLAKAHHAAHKSRTKPPALDSVRLTVQVEGSWRPRFQSDGSGWDQRSYQLLVSRWGFKDFDGMTTLGGRPPVL